MDYSYGHTTRDKQELQHEVSKILATYHGYLHCGVKKQETALLPIT